MSRRGWTTAALLLLAVIGLVLLGTERQRPTPALYPETAELRLLVLEGPRGQRVVLERRPAPAAGGGSDRWWLTEPFVLPADDARVERVLAMLAAAPLESFRSDEPLAAFGLDPPERVLRAESTTLLLGATAEAEAIRYVLSGNAVAVVPGASTLWMAFPPLAFAHPGPLGPTPTPTQFELPDMELRLHGGSWVARPAQAGLSADQLVALVDAWRNARALSVRPLRPAAGPTRPVTVHLASGPAPAVLRFLVLRRPGEVVLQREDIGVQYHFPQAAGERLLGIRPARVAPGVAPDSARGDRAG